MQMLKEQMQMLKEVSEVVCVADFSALRELVFNWYTGVG